MSCVKKGYMKDDYIHLFVRRPVRRSPIINRGYFARWAAIRKLLYQFLDVEKKSDEDLPIKKQKLSLGAGFDTTYFQLQGEGKAPYLYVEVDFKEEHYCVAYAINDVMGLFGDFGFVNDKS